MTTTSWARWVAAALALLVLPFTADAAAALLLRPAQVWTAGEPLHSGWVLTEAIQHATSMRWRTSCSS